MLCRLISLKRWGHLAAPSGYKKKKYIYIYGLQGNDMNRLDHQIWVRESQIQLRPKVRKTQPDSNLLGRHIYIYIYSTAHRDGPRTQKMYRNFRDRVGHRTYLKHAFRAHSCARIHALFNIRRHHTPYITLPIGSYQRRELKSRHKIAIPWC